MMLTYRVLIISILSIFISSCESNKSLSHFKISDLNKVKLYFKNQGININDIYVNDEGIIIHGFKRGLIAIEYFQDTQEYRYSLSGRSNKYDFPWSEKNSILLESKEALKMLPAFKGRIIKYENLGLPPYPDEGNTGPMMKIYLKNNDNYKTYVISRFFSGKQAPKLIEELIKSGVQQFPETINKLSDSK